MNIYFIDILFILWGYQDILFLMSYQKNGIYPPTKSGIYPLYGKTWYILSHMMQYIPTKENSKYTPLKKSGVYPVRKNMIYTPSQKIVHAH